jgi:alcohol dehydrogenase YqhD (iron-dependent ADH family)
MLNFEYHNPTKILFGRGYETQVGQLARPYGSKLLLHYGGKSIKRSGLYDRVIASLQEAGVDFVELGGVQPNPRLALVREGIELARREKVDLILAVGGGSVIDSAKAIALGVDYAGDVWDFYEQKAVPEKALPVAVILTIPAAGSENSPNSVITHEALALKVGTKHTISRPVFSILNPELCMTLPREQIGYGVCDMMAHIMERYFTHTTHVDLTDRLCEGALRTAMENGRKLMRDSQDYDAWAEIMATGTLAHNGLLGTGRAEDWASHKIEHELSAIYDVPHGAGLAVIFPAWIKYVWRENPDMFLQFAVRVMDVDCSFRDKEGAVLEGIRRLEGFYKEMDLPIRLRELGIGEERLTEMAEKALLRGPIGGLKVLEPKDVLEILKLALK